VIADRIKTALYHTGALGAYHRVRHRRHVTVALFHRVLPRDDPRWTQADPVWTVSTTFLAECLDFFRRHYTVVSIADVLERVEADAPLPPRPLAVTFDDGWADACEHALPVLRAKGVPATVFVIAGEVDGVEPWQDLVRRAWRRAEPSGWPWPCAELGEIERPRVVADLIASLSAMSDGRRARILGAIREATGDVAATQMLSRDQVVQLSRAGCEIGSHGLTHTSIPSSASPWEEVAGSRQTLAAILDGHADAPPTCFAFPNGRWDARSLDLAVAAGYRAIFTSDPGVNVVPSDRSRPLVLGRVSITAAPLTDADGHLCPELLAWRLFSLAPRTVAPGGM